MRKYILNAIIKKDLKEMIRNPQTIIILGITVGINIFMAMIISKPLWVMTFAMSLVMIGFTITAFMITEEKDKKTLEALLVSPASYNEILLGKLFLTFSLTVIITLTLIYSLHFNEVSFLHTLISVPIGAMVICLFGMVIGLICPTQAALSGIGTILMLALFLPELMSPINNYVGYFARALPTHHVVQIANLGRDGFSTLLMKHYGVLILSLVSSIFWVKSFIKTASSQESNKWKFSRPNKITSFILLLTLVFSSYSFNPVRGSIIQLENGESRYVNKKYKISIPIDLKKFKMKEFDFQDRYVVRFAIKKSASDYLYLSIRKNRKKINHEKDLKNILVKLKKEDVINLKVQEKSLSQNKRANLLEYESKNGKEMLYLFNNGEFLFRIGVEASGKNYNSLVKTLENNFQKLQILD